MNEELAGNTHEEGASAPSSVGGSGSITPPSTPGLQESGMSTTPMDIPGVPAAATGAKYGKNKGLHKKKLLYYIRLLLIYSLPTTAFFICYSVMNSYFFGAFIYVLANKLN